MTTTEKKQILAKFMNYTNNRPLTTGLLNTLFNDWNSLILVVQNIECIEGPLSYSNYKNNAFAELLQIREAYIFNNAFEECINFIVWYNSKNN